MLLNGVQVAVTGSSFSAFTSFTIGSGFLAGTNTLDFVVNNGGSSPNPTGLRVDLSGTASTSTQPATGYRYGRVVTIDHTKVPNTDQANFPFLFNTTDAMLKTASNGGHVNSIYGYDIIFTSDAAGTQKLDHEIESYNPASGQFIAWVRIPALSHTTDTAMYLFYGNSSIATSQENKTAVWNSNYKSVWHFSEDPNGA